MGAFRTSSALRGGSIAPSLLFALVANAGCGAEFSARREVASPGQGGAAGWQPGVAGSAIAGRAADELGWVYPLDVERPRPPRPPADLLPRFAGDPDSGAPSEGETRLGADDSHSQNETAIALAGTTLVAGWNSFVDGSVVIEQDSSGSIRVENVKGNVDVKSDSSGDIYAARVTGNFTVSEDSSGSIDHDGIGGRVTIPDNKQD